MRIFVYYSNSLNGCLIAAVRAAAGPRRKSCTSYEKSESLGDSLGGREGQPKYKVIFETVKERLLSGEYKYGERLPSEGELERRFGVSRMTVVRALRELQQARLVVRRAGSGTYAAYNRTEGSHAFGLLIPELGQTEIFEPICQGMARYPSSSKYSLI